MAGVSEPMDGITTTEALAGLDLDTDHTIDDLLRLSTQLWVQMLDYEKTVEQILKLDRWLRKHQAKPIQITIPRHNFRFSVGEGVKNMYDKFRLRQWFLVKDTAYTMESQSRQHRGLDMIMNISAVQAETPFALQTDLPSQYWLLVDREQTRES